MATSVIGNPNVVSAEIGEIKIWSGITAPSKWIVCDGGVVSRTTYRDLFEVIGTEFGGGMVKQLLLFQIFEEEVQWV